MPTKDLSLFFCFKLPLSFLEFNWSCSKIRKEKLENY